MGLFDMRLDGGLASSSKAAQGTNKADFHLLGINGPIKRAFDVVISAIIILFLMPLFLLIAVAIKAQGGPLLYRQARLGRGGRKFNMLKFRSMYVDADDRLSEILSACPNSKLEWMTYQKLRNDPRITPFGRFLRKSSLDELPQLFNVLLGDMSLVGQRPILPSQRDAYGRHITGYERARPGLTGLWQVSGRNNLGFEDRAALGSEYINRWSLWYDFKLLLKTVPAVLLSRDAF